MKLLAFIICFFSITIKGNEDIAVPSMSYTFELNDFKYNKIKLSACLKKKLVFYADSAALELDSLSFKIKDKLYLLNLQDVTINDLNINQRVVTGIKVIYSLPASDRDHYNGYGISIQYKHELPWGSNQILFIFDYSKKRFTEIVTNVPEAISIKAEKTIEKDVKKE